MTKSTITDPNYKKSESLFEIFSHIGFLKLWLMPQKAFRLCFLTPKLFVEYFSRFLETHRLQESRESFMNAR